jgi:choloylglycine hydrolase
VRAYVGIVVVLGLVLHLGASSSRSCTGFVLRGKGKPIFAKNFDYGFGGGLLVVNKRNVAKTAASPQAPAQWVAKYGSVTFNLYGRELPMGGMNEEGLVVECMWLDESEYPPPDGRPTLSDLQWIQYQLDNSATVSEVVENASLVRPFGYGGSKIHCLVTDRNGDCAVVEYIGGKLVVRAGKQLPVPALTNSTYDNSVGFLEQFAGDENAEMYLVNSRSLGRFVIASRAVESFESKPQQDGIPYAFDVLSKASAGEYTQWSIVYDVSGRSIQFRTKENPSIRVIDFADLDFSCQKPVLIHDLTATGSGSIAKDLEDYTYEKNKALVTKTFTTTDFLKDTPAPVLEYLSRYPEQSRCSEPRGSR